MNLLASMGEKIYIETYFQQFSEIYTFFTIPGKFKKIPFNVLLFTKPADIVLKE